MRLILFFILASFPLFSSDSFENGKKLAEEILKNTESGTFDRNLLKQELQEISPKKATAHTFSPDSKCISGNITPDPVSNLYVFVSFSMPDETFMSLSKELEKVGGILVVRGLPQNSFKDLGKKLYALRNKGVNAHLQINPKLFKKFEILNVPTFVVLDGDKFDKLNGNVSVSFALNKMASENAEAAKKARML